MLTDDLWNLNIHVGSTVDPSGPSWHFWTPEVLRRAGGAATCAMPVVDRLIPGHPRALMSWGPLLPLLNYHLGWADVEAGLARWAIADFDVMDDPTLATISELWGPMLALHKRGCKGR